MIITHTSNPSIDYYIALPGELFPGIHRIEKGNFLPGGKGLNVSMLLNELGIPSVATAFLGGFSGRFIRTELEKYSQVTLEGVEVEEASRINVKIRGRDEVDLNASGPVISKDQQQAMLEKLDILQPGDWFLICGSLARGMGEEFLFRAAERVREKGAKLVLDVPGISARLMEKLKPTLIKPNVEELYDLFGCSEKEAEVGGLIEKLQELGVESILLSKGGDGAEYYGPAGNYRITQPSLKAVNTVGAGDSMLAAFVGMLDSGARVAEALKTAAAAGAATAVSEGLATRDRIEALRENVTVTAL